MNYGLQVMAQGHRRGVLPGALLAWDFHEQSGNTANNVVNALTPSNNVMSLGERGFQITPLWKVTSGSLTITDNFALGPDGINQSATRMVAGGVTAVLNGASQTATLALPPGNVTVSAWMKLNTGSSATITPDIIGPNSTGSWSVTSSWQRFTFTKLNSLVNTTGVAFFIPAATDLLVYGIQLEQASAASSYVAPTLNLAFSGAGSGATDVPSWSGNGTITSTNAQRGLAISDADLSLTTCTAYIAIKSTSTTVQTTGATFSLATPTASGEPQKLELQTSFWNANAGNPTPAGGSRSFDPFIGFGGLSREFPAGNLYDQKWHICAVVGDGTTTHLYIDGILVDGPAAAASGTPASVSAGIFCLGRPDANNSFPGQYAYVSLYANAVHTYAQIKQNTAAIASAMTAKGLSNVTGVANGLLVFEGDSITDGIGTGNVGHPALLGAHYGRTWVNYATSGAQIAQLTARTAQLDALIDPTKRFNVLVVNIGRNDLDHINVAGYQANLTAYWQARVAAGWTVIATTLLPTTGVTVGPLVASANTSIRGAWAAAGCAALADWGSDATILANYTNTAYLYDGTHPTALTYTIMAPYAQNAIDGLNLGV